MEEKDTYGPVVGIVIVVAILFFGGWYVFLGNASQNTPNEIINLPAATGVVNTAPSNPAANESVDTATVTPEAI